MPRGRRRPLIEKQSGAARCARTLCPPSRSLRLMWNDLRCQDAFGAHLPDPIVTPDGTSIRSRRRCCPTRSALPFSSCSRFSRSSASAAESGSRTTLFRVVVRSVAAGGRDAEIDLTVQRGDTPSHIDRICGSGTDRAERSEERRLAGGVAPRHPRISPCRCRAVDVTALDRAVSVVGQPQGLRPLPWRSRSCPR